MFHNSTQKKFWTFADEDQLKKLWQQADFQFRTDYCKRNEATDRFDDNFFLTHAEHCAVVKHYETQLRDFCSKFKPVMGANVVGTSCMYMKRFYLRTSVMDHHPRNIYLVCIWLACKTEEFNVSIAEFLRNLSDDQALLEKTSMAILDLEMTVLQQLNYDLTIHNPFRSFEGLVIDLKTRYPHVPDPDQLHANARNFLLRTLQTNIPLLFPPSQIAFAALCHSAKMASVNIDKYLTNVLFEGQSRQVLDETIRRIRKIRLVIANAEKDNFSPQLLQNIIAKLENCYLKYKDPMLDGEYIRDYNCDEQDEFEFKSKKPNHQQPASKRRRREEQLQTEAGAQPSYSLLRF